MTSQIEDSTDHMLDREQKVATRMPLKIFALANEVMGSESEAERWLAQPAMGLDGRLPIDLLDSAEGVGILEQFLTQVKYGVYA